MARTSALQLRGGAELLPVELKHVRLPVVCHTRPLARRPLERRLPLSDVVRCSAVLCGAIECCRALWGTIGYYRVLQGTIGYYRVLQGTTGYLTGTIECYRVLQGT